MVPPRWLLGALFRVRLNFFRSNVNDFTLRSHTCGELTLRHQGVVVTLFGWLAFKRMNRFLVLRDAYGSVQVRIPDGRPDLTELANTCNYESVLRVRGSVEDRGEQHRNLEKPTGEIEVVAEELEMLNQTPAQMPLMGRIESAEETRLRYRYLDLRTPSMQSALRLRSKIVHRMRKFLCEQADFVEIETPTLFRCTPGGAKEFMVPAPKPNLGKFYSLPQSPQQFKQLLMCGAIDRYFQFARCYRDEGAKSDRQPEFTQVDLEISFTTQDCVMDLVEKLITESWPPSMNSLRPERPFRRLRYSEAVELYGSDKPDLRIPWTLIDSTADLAFLNTTDSPHFAAKMFIASGIADRITRALRVEWTRILATFPNLAKFAIFKPKQKSWFQSIEKDYFMQKFGIGSEDACIIAWGEKEKVESTLGQLRNLVAEAVGLRATQRFEFLWVVDFPLFIRGDEGRLESAHHPFTAPIPEHSERIYLPDQAHSITAQHYDLVVNGVELGGGSIRIHNAQMQRFVLENILHESSEQLKHLLDALSTGGPPHGGFALGLDRYIALMVGEGNSNVSIRDVIAFPKSKESRDVMSDSPADVTEEQLQRYGISLRPATVLPVTSPKQ